MNSTTNKWDVSYSNSQDYLAFTTQDINTIISAVDPSAPKTLLDIGCGTGQVSREFFHHGYETVGIDGSSKAIEIAKASTLQRSISYIHSSFESYVQHNKNSSTYGLIVCKYVFAFIEDRNYFLKNVAKLLDPSGTFVLITPDISKIPIEKIDIAVPHEAMLAALSNYFKVEHNKRGRDYYYFCKSIKIDK